LGKHIKGNTVLYLAPPAKTNCSNSWKSLRTRQRSRSASQVATVETDPWREEAGDSSCCSARSEALCCLVAGLHVRRECERDREIDQGPRRFVKNAVFPTSPKTLDRLGVGTGDLLLVNLNLNFPLVSTVMAAWRFWDRSKVQLFNHPCAHVS
jgi:hypothetical protein